MRPKQLTKSKFFDVYGIFLIAQKYPNKIPTLLEYLLPIANHYFEISDYALRSELRYVNSQHMTAKETGGWWAERKTLNKTSRYYIKDIQKRRKVISLSECMALFNNRNWDRWYGGKKWGEITKATIDLEKHIKAKDFWKILYSIDRLNDLEHNDALYLKSYCTFNLLNALNYKYNKIPDHIFKYCSDEIKRLNKQSYSLVAQYH